MQVVQANSSLIDPDRPASGRRPGRSWRKVRLLALTYLILFAAVGLIGELGFRLFWNPKYWVRCDQLLVGAGQTEAGRKWWPETTYQIESREFRVEFRTNARGYRARPEPPKTGHPYRIAFVGDSFTEAMQVDEDQTFCARIERALADSSRGREVVCENFGVSATGLFDYWHRIRHDVLRPDPPDALVLCLYPGNDFSEILPDDGFEADGRPKSEYFRPSGGIKHVLTWLNLKSKFSYFLQRSLLVASMRLTTPPVQGPKFWWTDPALAAKSAEAPAVRRSKALMRAIAEDCRRSGTKLCILVVGPVTTYAAKDGRSPLGRLFADWGIDAPVIDVAIVGLTVPGFESLLFPGDGHLNERGHEFVAAWSAPALETILLSAEERVRSAE